MADFGWVYRYMGGERLTGGRLMGEKCEAERLYRQATVAKATRVINDDSSRKNCAGHENAVKGAGFP